MDFDELMHAWTGALRRSGLSMFGAFPSQETVDLRSLDRNIVTVVEAYPPRAPFMTTARLSWRWSALHTARTTTTEEDAANELLGRDPLVRVRTARPWLRVDIALRSTLPWRKPLPMPAKPTWAAWTSAVMTAFETHTPLLPDDSLRAGGRLDQLEIFGTMNEPEAEVACSRDGDVKLAAVKLEAWQALELARKWSDPRRRPDQGTHEQLDAMFARVKAALAAWNQLATMLVPTGS